MVVGDWADEQALAAQLAENLQRQDLHVLDEMRGYVALVDDHAWDVPRLCREVGRSRSYVYGRLRLRSLSADCLAALEAGEVGPTVARCLATVPRALQDEALHCLREQWGEVSSREAEELIADHFRRDLDDAAFDPRDATLKARWEGGRQLGQQDPGVPFDGELACSACRWNTSNDESLGGAPQACVQPKCFDGKERQETDRRIARAEAAGRTVIRGDESDFEWGSPKASKFVTGYERTGALSRAQDTGADIETSLLVSEDGQVFEVLDRAEARKKGVLATAASRLGEKERKKEKRARERIGQAVLALEEALPRGDSLPPAARALLRLLIDELRQRAFSHVLRRLARERWGDDLLEHWRNRDGGWVAALPDGDLLRFGVQLCAAMVAEDASAESSTLLRQFAAEVEDGGFTWNEKTRR